MSRAINDALGWARDTLQGRILAQIFAQRVQGVVLKGGMAFRVGHSKWARATKDIDLDADEAIPLPALQNNMRRAIQRATADGLLENVQITEPKQTGTTARWKISGLYPRTGQMLNLTVEVSRRESIDSSETIELDSLDGSRQSILVYNDRSLAFKKVKALMCDTREAPRDISDLFLLIQAHVDPPVPELRRWFAQHGPYSVKALWDKLERMDKETFKAEVLPSLPPSVEGQQFYQDWEQIRLIVGTHLESWIAQASCEDPVVSSEPLHHSTLNTEIAEQALVSPRPHVAKGL